MTLSLRYKINAPHIVHEVFEDQEAAIINLKSGNYYSLNSVGAAIWSMIEPGATVGEIVEEVITRYDGTLVDIINAVNKFVANLQEEDLIIAAPAESDGVSNQRSKAVATEINHRPSFSGPLLERYNDMQELLLLDPIHEVDETGWPNRKQDAAN